MRRPGKLWYSLILVVVLVGGGLVVRNQIRQARKRVVHDAPGLDASTCVASTWPRVESNVTLEPVFDPLRFHRAVGLYRHPVIPDRWYVLEKEGTVWTFREGDGYATEWIDLREFGVRAVENEAGLFAMAFHPQFADNGRVFFSYTTEGVPLETHVAELHASLDGQFVLGPPREVLDPLPQFFKNHFAGDIKFGPDGFLYFSLGDGRTPGDMFQNGQDTFAIRGKLLRIDVDRRERGKNYGIPKDNPFADGRWGAPEVFAYGFRNMWRFTFDSETGEIWGGDVGQYQREELNLIVKGGNYGWNVKEGTRCFSEPCDESGLIDPVAEHPHNEAIAIVAGAVYRGRAIPELRGKTVYADHATGRVYAVKKGGKPEVLISGGPAISHVTEDADGELLFVGYGEQRYVKAVTQGGRIYRLVPSQVEGAGAAPLTLSRTGCVDPAKPTVVAASLIPYEVNAPLWSDGADKRRWISLPPDAKIEVGEDGDWELPVGTVLVKEFAVAGKRVETRLFVHHEDGDWSGFSYEWDEDQKDATLVADGKVVTVGAGGQTWTIPSRGQCLECHTQAAGRSLGLESGQLDRDFAKGTTFTGNQLDYLRERGLLAEPEGRTPRFASYGGSASLEEQARSYLHSNCSHCHRPGGTAQAEMDLRKTTTLAAMNACGVEPNISDLGIAGAKLITPGDSSKSVMTARMRHPSDKRMPPLATAVIDEQGAGIVARWIDSLSRCN